MTTPLFKEALIDSKKLKDMAETKARHNILENLAPAIKSLIDKEIEVSSINEADEEEVTDPNMGMDPLSAVANDPATASAVAAGAEVPSEPVGANTTAAAVPAQTPMQPTAASSATGAAPIATPASMSGSPAIDPDGKITVDIEMLFANMKTTDNSSAPISTPVNATTLDATQPAEPVGENPPIAASGGDEEPLASGGSEEESPMPPVEEPDLQETEEKLSYDYFKEMIGSLHESINSKKESIKKNAIVKKMFEEKLFSLFEKLEISKDKKQISLSEARISERYLNVLYQQIMESEKERNSYTGQRKESMRNQSLKDFARSLFEEKSSLAAEGDVESLANDGFEEKAKAKVHNSSESDKASKHAMAASKSKIEDPGKKASLTVSESDMSVDSDMAKLEEELSNMLGGGAGVMEEEGMDDMSDVSEQEVQMEAAKIRREALQRKLASIKEEEAKLQKQLAECGGQAPVNVNITIDGAAVGGDEMEMGHDASGLGDLDMGDEGSEDSMEDSMDSDSELSADSDEDTLEIIDDEGGEEEGSEEEEEMPSLAESKAPLAAKLVKENRAVKGKLAEAQTSLAKSLYMNKLFYGLNLSGSQKQKIASAMDDAKTIAEARAVYDTARKALASNKVGATRTAGTSAGVAKPASTAAPLNESVSNSNGWSGPTFDPERWQVLAGIKKV